MIRVATNKWILLLVLFLSIIISSYLVYKNNFHPETILLKEVTYYLPGQRNNCKWILQVENNLKNIPGETTEVRIGIPEAQVGGYLSGRLEVGQHNNLMLAFIPPGSKTNKIPVILTADFSDRKLPIDFLRFRWVQSSTITILIFASEESCIVSRNKK